MSSNSLKTTIAIALVAATVIGAHLLPGFDSSRVDAGVRNGVHVVVFAVLAIFVFAALTRTALRTPNAVLLTMLLAAIVGGSAGFIARSCRRYPGFARDPDVAMGPQPRICSYKIRRTPCCCDSHRLDRRPCFILAIRHPVRPPVGTRYPRF